MNRIINKIKLEINRNRSKIINLRQLVFVTLLMIGSFYLMWQILATNNKIVKAKKQTTELLAKQASLQYDVDFAKIKNEYYKSDTFIELELKRSGGKVAPGERLYLLSDQAIKRNTPDNIANNKNNNTENNNLKKWIDYYFTKKQ